MTLPPAGNRGSRPLPKPSTEDDPRTAVSTVSVVSGYRGLASIVPRVRQRSSDHSIKVAGTLVTASDCRLRAGARATRSSLHPVAMAAFRHPMDDADIRNG